MAQKLSYAGITLPLSTPEHQAWLEQVHPPQLFTEWTGWNFDKPNQVRGFGEGLPFPNIPTPPDFKLGVLHWPTGAARPAWFHAVVNTERLALIRSAVGSPMTPQPLVMFDGRTGKTITAQMYMLPARPLNQLGHASSDGWLLTLTDQRFYWYYRRGAIGTQLDSWFNLYVTVASILGIEIDIDSIDPSYGAPSRKWINYYNAGGVLLDAVAEQVGQRIVVGLDGVVRAVNWEAAKLASDAYLAAADPEISGGVISRTDICQYLPGQVDVLFVNANTIPPVAAPHVISRNMFSYGSAVCPGASGNTLYTGTIFADTPYTTSASGNAVSYADAAAADYYGWAANDVDIVYPGIEPWIPTGWEDVIEWTLQKREAQPFASTAIRRGPWNDMVSGDWYAGQEPIAPPQEIVCDPGCGWIAGMASGWCLTGNVIGAWGQCEGINTSQTFTLRYSTGEDKWVSQQFITGQGWVDQDFTYHQGQGPLRVWLDGTTDSIAASINDIDLVLHCCGENYAIFAGGAKIDPTFCTGTIPEPCPPNVFRVKVQCTACPPDPDCTPIAGWGGAGWYCIEVDSACTTVVELIDQDRCDNQITICSGPYASEEIAIISCTGPISTSCCEEAVPANLYASGFDVGFCNIGTIHLVYNSISDSWRPATGLGETICGSEGWDPFLELSCESNGAGGWRWRLNIWNNSCSATQDIYTCSPFSVEFDFSTCNEPFCFGCTIPIGPITVSETP